MTNKNLKTTIFVAAAILLIFAGFWFFGCGRGVPDATTTTSTTAATTTTIFAHGISGTATNYGGSDNEVGIIILRNSPSLLEGEEINAGTFTITGSEVAYSLSVEAAGNYYVVGVDFSQQENPSLGDWVGAYGWMGTDSVEVEIGEMMGFEVALLANAVSIEVSSMATANFTMHEIVPEETEEAQVYTVSGTAPAGSAGYFVVCCDRGDPRSVLVEVLISAEVQGNLSFSLANIPGSPETISASIWSTWPTDTVVNNLEYMYDYAEDGNSGSEGDLFSIDEDTVLDTSKWLAYDPSSSPSTTLGSATTSTTTSTTMPRFTASGTAPAGSAGYIVICVDHSNQFTTEASVVSAEVQENLSFSLSNVPGDTEVQFNVLEQWPAPNQWNDIVYLYDEDGSGDLDGDGFADLFIVVEDMVLDQNKWIVYQP